MHCSHAFGAVQSACIFTVYDLAPSANWAISLLNSSSRSFRNIKKKSYAAVCVITLENNSVLTAVGLKSCSRHLSVSKLFANPSGVSNSHWIFKVSLLDGGWRQVLSLSHTTLLLNSRPSILSRLLCYGGGVGFAQTGSAWWFHLTARSPWQLQFKISWTQRDIWVSLNFLPY